jgi:hypothetical protein
MFHWIVGLIKREPGASVDGAPAGNVEEAEDFPRKEYYEEDYQGSKSEGNFLFYVPDLRS